MLAFFRTRPDEKTPPAKAAVSLVIAAALIVGFFWLSLSRIDYRPDFSFLPEFTIRREVEQKRLTALKVRGFQMQTWRQIFYHKDKWVTKEMQEFLRLAREMS